MARTLLSWIGFTDLASIDPSRDVGSGPIRQAIAARTPNRVILLSDRSPADLTGFVAAISADAPDVALDVRQVALPSPVHFASIYEHARAAIDHAASRTSAPELEVLLSAGTPAMAAVWILLVKTHRPATLLESSRNHGVNVADVPFDISADYIPETTVRYADAAVQDLLAGNRPPTPAFDTIVARSREMRRVIDRARRIAPRDVPILILGETGTGKELLSRAIHQSSRRSSGPFVAVNCGAIPPEICESELFGHIKGSFTGATRERLGHLREAHGGTLFLDEIGDLPAFIQVKLLRFLQEGEVVPVGASRPHQSDARVIAATHRDLHRDMQAGTFREDLFHRLAVAIFNLPPLRQRAEDVGPMIDTFLEEVNARAAADTGEARKDLSAAGRNLLLRQDWPGNVRELRNSLLRAWIWCPTAIIRPEDVTDALLPRLDRAGGILDRDVSQGLDLAALLSSVARHYLESALAETGGNLSRAADLVGLQSRQTFRNWMRRHGVED